MSSVAVVCPRCQSSLPGALCNTGTPVSCPACDTSIQVEIFPVFFKPAAAGQSGETILEEGVSSCFYHEQKKAVVHCDACGRFLCALCDLDFNGQHLCSACLQTGKKKGSIPELENRRTIYDRSALVLALLPLMVTAPVAVVLAVLSFFRPPSLIRRTRLLAWVALLLGLFQIALWVILFWSIS
jgi:hypothetical protein